MLEQLNFLVHGFCYSEMVRGKWRNKGSVSAHLDRERLVSERWRSAVLEMPEDSGLALIPWGHGAEGPAADFEKFAEKALGERFFLLDVPMLTDPKFWEIAGGDLGRELLGELRSAYLGQKHFWNLEELDTAVHSMTAIHAMKEIMTKRRISYDPGRMTGEAWGAAFEGCVVKYIGNINRILGLVKPVEVNYDLGVPDARFILKVNRWERLSMEGSLRLFMLETGRGPVALYYSTIQGMGQQAQWVEVPLDPCSTRVIDKLGNRLWPGRPVGRPPRMELGYYEPKQRLVIEEKGKLKIPVNGGLVYRRAKAPAYILPGKETTWDEFKELLLQGHMAPRPPAYC